MLGNSRKFILCGPIPFQKQMSHQDYNWEKTFLLLIYATSMTNLRYISFCSEWCEYRKKPESERKEKMNFSLLAMFHYCTYLPTCFTGPMCTYYHFYKQVSSLNSGWILVILSDVVHVSNIFLVMALILEILSICLLRTRSLRKKKLPEIGLRETNGIF